MKRFALLGILALLAAHEALAVYVVVLRSGTRIIAKEKYTLKGTTATFETKDGSLTSIPISQIDVEASDKVNSLNLSSAQSLDWVDVPTVYVVVLRNGSRVVARSKYKVKGPNAIIETKIGTLTSIPLSQIDLGATEKVNSYNLGDAQTLDWVDLQKVLPTPTPTPAVSALGRILPGVAAKEGEAAKPTPTPGVTYRDVRYRDPQVDQAFQQGLESYHLYLYRTSEGTQPAFLFIEMQVNGQPEALKTLEAICTTYTLLAEKAPTRLPERVEIRMLNESGREAGIFRISAADAAELVSGKTTADKFFVQHVIF